MTLFGTPTFNKCKNIEMHFLTGNKASIPWNSLRYKNCMFRIPEEKMKKLVSLIKEIIKWGISNFVKLEKTVGKCRSISVGVPAAVLHTRTQHKK